MWVRDHSRSLILVPFESLLSSPSLAISETFSIKEWPDLENMGSGSLKVIENGEVW